MNTNSIESQQNANTQPENSKIAEIYQRMLLGEKSALASLQKLKTPSPKQLIHSRQQQIFDEQSPEFTRKKSMNRTEIQPKSQNSYSAKESPFERIKTINEEPLQESMLRDKEKDKQQEKLRSYIKKKVNELRSEKQIMRNQQEREIGDIRKVSDNRKTHTVNQSKSYDLVKRKQFVHKTANQTGTGMSAVKQQVKKAFQSISIQQSMSKIQSSSKPNYNKHLPPLKQRKKIPTQTSQKNQDLAESKIIPRKDIRTPINLADSSLKVQLKPSQSNEMKTKNSPSKSAKQQPSNKKKEQSRVKKISLPEMRRMREQFAAINEKQKAAQLDMMQSHMETKHFVEQVRVRNGLNYRNYERLVEMKKCLNPQPVSTTLKTIPSLKQQHPQQPKKKKAFAIQQEKIQQAFEDIKLIEEAIAKKRSEVSKIENKLNTNLLVQFWDSYDLQQYDFGEDQDDLPEIEIYQPQSISESKLTQAYSTAMPQTKDKKWKRKAIKQYDTNRSFQEYAKSRSQFKPNNKLELNKIQENEQDQQEDNGINKVTVNSRLRKLLLQ